MNEWMNVSWSHRTDSLLNFEGKSAPADSTQSTLAGFVLCSKRLLKGVNDNNQLMLALVYNPAQPGVSRSEYATIKIFKLVCSSCCVTNARQVKAEQVYHITSNDKSYWSTLCSMVNALRNAPKYHFIYSLEWLPKSESVGCSCTFTLGQLCTKQITHV